MARKSRKQKKRRTRRKRGGLTPKQTKQCEAAGIPGFPPAKCQEYLQNLKNKPAAATTATTKPLLTPGGKNEIKKGKEGEIAEIECKKLLCKDDDTKTYGESGNCSKLREKIKYMKNNPKSGQQAAIKKICDGKAKNICKKTCGTVCAASGGGRRTRSRRGKGDKPKGAQPKCPPGLYWDAVGLKCSPPDDVYDIAKMPHKVGGKRRRRRKKSRRKSRKRRSRRKSKRRR
jgi:hypothetical protein